MIQKEELKLLDILQSTLGNSFHFKNIDEFLKDLIKTHPMNKTMTLDNQKQIKNQICDIFSQIKGKKISATSKEISKILYFLNKKLISFEILHSFEYEFALDVFIIKNIFYFFKKDHIFCFGKFSRQM